MTLASALRHASSSSLLAKTGGDTWFFLTANYAFAHALERDTAAVVVKNGGKVLLERSAKRLLEKETLDEKDLTELVGPPTGPPVRAVAAQ
jgi:hypothetical protein